MKNIINFAPTFVPASKTLDFSNFPNTFDLRGLVAIFNVTRNVMIYGIGITGYTSFASNILTLEYDTTTHNAADVLQIHYDASGSYLKAFSAPVALPSDEVVVRTAQSVLNTNLLTGSVSGWYDAKDAHSASVTLVGSAGISAGQIIFEQTNDTTIAPNGTTMPVQEPATAANNNLIGAQTIAASATRTFVFPVTCKYVRVRISTAFVGGTISIAACFSQLSFASLAVNAMNATAANMAVTASLASAQTLATVTTVNSVTSANLGLPVAVVDVASAALTTTTTTSSITPSGGVSHVFVVPVTATSGTNQTLDINVEESDDAGTNWRVIYSFPRITGIGIYRSPKVNVTGNRVRYVQTLTGSSPSFTRSITRLQLNEGNDSNFRQLINRTLAINTISSVSPALTVHNAANLQVVLSLAAGGTAPTIQLQGTFDNGVTWVNIGTTLAGTVGSTLQLTIPDINVQQIRAIVTAAGTDATLNYLLLKGF